MGYTLECPLSPCVERDTSSTTLQILDWNYKQFSKGGKEVLIKAVPQAIPTFAISCFRIPTSICKDMEKLCAKFWWKGDKHRKGLHWKSWDKLC